MEAYGKVEPLKLSLKLTVHKLTNKVLFADVEKDFVDILISFLTLPLGTIARLVTKECDMGPLKIASLSSLYESVGNVGDRYMLTDSCKEMLLQPRNPMEDYCRSLKINIDDTEPTKYYVCSNLVHCRNAGTVMCSTFKYKKCSCSSNLDKQILPKSCFYCDGFVKNASSFLVSDDLCLLPMSLRKSLFYIKRMDIEDMSSVEEIVVDVTKNKLIDLLKCALISKTPLTDVFLRKKLCLQKYDCKSISPSYFCEEEECTPVCEEQCTPIKVNIMYKKSDGKVICAQGKEDFANFLLSILTFPLGAVVRLSGVYSCMGSIDGLYKSVVDLSEDYFESKDLKDDLADLGPAPQFQLSNPVLPLSEFRDAQYYCVTYNSFNSGTGTYDISDFHLDTNDPGIMPASDGTSSTVEMVDPISENESSKGFVKGPTFYVATDDLVVSPISSISAVTLINNMNITLSDIEEKEVSIGRKEGLRILEASLTSSMALTRGLAHLLTNVKREDSSFTKVKRKRKAKS